MWFHPLQCIICMAFLLWDIIHKICNMTLGNDTYYSYKDIKEEPFIDCNN
jgi:hypothetical protein